MEEIENIVYGFYIVCAIISTLYFKYKVKALDSPLYVSQHTEDFLPLYNSVSGFLEGLRQLDREYDYNSRKDHKRELAKQYKQEYLELSRLYSKAPKTRDMILDEINQIAEKSRDTYWTLEVLVHILKDL